MALENWVRRLDVSQRLQARLAPLRNSACEIAGRPALHTPNTLPDIGGDRYSIDLGGIIFW